MVRESCHVYCESFIDPISKSSGHKPRISHFLERQSKDTLWIDGIETVITRSDAKTSYSPGSRICEYFLTWMKKWKHAVFITASVDQIDLVRPEILRKGRFDEIFFSPFPSHKERRYLEFLSYNVERIK